MYGAMIMRSVMEEKTNRIVEIILSSVKPFKLMMGKILGVGAVGVTQYAIWIVLLVIINFVMAFFIGDSINPNQVGGASPQDVDAAMEMVENLQMQFASLPLGLIVFGFLFYFITGYVFYAALYAGLASAINDESDAQTLTFPIAIPIIISIIILSGMLDSPNSSIAVWASIIPFFAPVIMPARLAFGMPPGLAITAFDGADDCSRYFCSLAGSQDLQGRNFDARQEGDIQRNREVADVFLGMCLGVWFGSCVCMLILIERSIFRIPTNVGKMF